MGDLRIESNIRISEATAFRDKRSLNMRYKVSKTNFSDHNLTLNIGKSFILKAMTGAYGSSFPVISYLGIGRSVHLESEGGGVPAASAVSVEGLSDPNPLYISVGAPQYKKLAEADAYPTSAEYDMYVVGKPELFDHFESGSEQLSVGEIGLFFNTTDPEEGWGMHDGGEGKLPYTIWARDNIIEKTGAPIVLTKSNTEGVYKAYNIKWTIFVR